MRVSVVAPCSPMPRERLERACSIVEAWGLEPVLGEHVLDRHPRLPYLAGLDSDRAADLQAAWLDPTTSAVLCARGGNGAHRVVDLLDYSAMRTVAPKVFVGYSDVTALHEALAMELGVSTLHGPVIATREFLEEEATAEGLRATLLDPDSLVKLTSPGAETLVPGTARGVTFGGNLSLLSDGLATPHSRLSGTGGILLLEDVSEDVSRIDRMLGQLLRTGWLSGVAGIALGSWRDCTPGPDVVRALLVERLAPLGVPVVGDLGFGHCPVQLTVPLGAMATLDADAATLTLDAPALA
nr:LD-carboxypeptidase [Nocardiopsis ansamitocini]